MFLSHRTLILTYGMSVRDVVLQSQLTSGVHTTTRVS